MSSHVFVKVKIRAVDARRFVREFKKEYGNRIEDARKLKTEGDVLDAWLGWMDGARPARLSAKDGCWRFPAKTWPLSGGFMKASTSSSTGAFPTSIRRRHGFHSRPSSDGALIAARSTRSWMDSLRSSVAP